MQRTLSELKTECIDREIILDPDKKYGKKDLILLLQEYSLGQLGEENISWGLRKRLEIDSPMLCFSFKHLKDGEKDECMESDDWMAEVKCDGVRMISTYHPSEGFRFFSRNLSVTNFLPVEYTDKIILWPNGKIENLIPSLGYEFKDRSNLSFVLDCELTCSNPNVDTTAVRGKKGTKTGTVLNAVSAILSIEAKDSITIQKTQNCPLEFQVFDVYEFDESTIWELPLRERLSTRKEIVSFISENGWEIQEVEGIIDNKQEFYDQILAEGGEGIVLKNLNSPYIPTSSRRRTGFVKRKRSVQESKGSDIDAFIIGFVPANPKKAWSHLIGAIKMGIFLTDKEEGEHSIHHIASVSAMPMEMREAMTTTDGDGNIALKEEYYRKVLIINGQDTSPKSRRFMHAIADWETGFREDKNHLDCDMSEEVLNSMIL
jgi:ATP-dependent DNA ligase